MKRKVRMAAVLAVLSIVVCGIPFTAAAAETAAVEDAGGLQPFALAGDDRFAVEIPAASYDRESGGALTVEALDGVDEAVVWNGESGYVFWDFTVSQKGRYYAAVRYRPITDNGLTTTLDYTVLASPQGEPYALDGAEKNISLKRPWQQAAEFVSDSKGNHLTPEQQEAFTWNTAPLINYEEGFSHPAIMELEAGDYRFGIKASGSNIALEAIRLYAVRELSGYAAYADAEAGRADAAAGEENVVVQAEHASLKSDSMIMPVYDRSTPATEPSDPVRLLLNAMGAESWKTAGQWVEWEFDAPADGYYTLSLRARQSVKMGLSVTRRIYIDGELLFDGMDGVVFPFSTKWYMQTLGESEPYRFYFEKGSHTIRMEIVAGAYEEIARNLHKAVVSLNDIYRRIIMVTSTSPDPYRDYVLDKAIPGLMEDLQAVYGNLVSENARIEAMGKRSSETATVKTLISQLASFLENPDSIPTRLSQFTSNISGLSSWLLDLKNQPLELDYIVVSPVGNEIPSGKAGFFESLLYHIRAIFASFVSNYDMVGDYSENAIKVWMSIGRDQAQLVKQLTEDRFTPREHVAVNVELIQQGLIESLLAGTGPDVVLFMGTGDPVTLASRGALERLSNKDGFAEVAARFSEQSLVPFYHGGDCYAIPLTRSFNVLFYRTDIFEELKLTVPTTWDELYAIIPVIQGKNLEIGIPDIFSTLLFQRGGRYFNDNLSATEFDTKEALDAFSQWTGFHTEYSLLLQYDFFNRFRTGEMPLAIAPYSAACQIEQSAPEIRGLWAMAPVPGTVNGGGINDTLVGNAGEACVILGNSSNKDDAWKFIQWFTETETQSAYAKGLEARLGPLARYLSANQDVVEGQSWSKEQKSLILSKWDQVLELPQIPANYYVSRNLQNAYRRVTYFNESPQQALLFYNDEINKEIQRKRIELQMD